MAPGDQLPSENDLATRLDVSRTVVRAILEKFKDKKIIAWVGREKRLLRTPEEKDWLEIQEGQLDEQQLERQFLDWILRFDVAPGTALNVSQLRRRFPVTPHMLHEFLASLSRFGLVRRRPKGGWELVGFTREFAVELSEFRMVLELNAVAHFVQLPPEDPIWKQLDELEQKHEQLAAEIDERFHDFSLLDEEFHMLIGSAVRNRFAAEFQKLISLIFHYHFQWDKTEERQRNKAAIGEHLRLISALKARDGAAATAAAADHLKTSKQTLLSSLRVHALA
ncbi:GntR family transcriptional regulator [Phyllobacterium salinisoli]|nr:GntR family transcriptional regulator [Phyllobacterium salinisoli]